MAMRTRRNNFLNIYTLWSRSFHIYFYKHISFFYVSFSRNFISSLKSQLQNNFYILLSTEFYSKYFDWELLVRLFRMLNLNDYSHKLIKIQQQQQTINIANSFWMFDCLQTNAPHQKTRYIFIQFKYLFRWQ